MLSTPINPHLLLPFITERKRVRIQLFQPLFWEDEEQFTGTILEKDDLFVRVKPGTADSPQPECLIAIANIAGLRAV